MEPGRCKRSTPTPGPDSIVLAVAKNDLLQDIDLVVRVYARRGVYTPMPLAVGTVVWELTCDYRAFDVQSQRGASAPAYVSSCGS